MKTKETLYNSKILDKIRKLLAKANDKSCSENEMSIFLAKANKMMKQYKISESDIDINISDIDISIIKTEFKTVFSNKNYDWNLLDTIANENNCSVTYLKVVEQDENENYVEKRRFNVIGTIESRELTIEMFKTFRSKIMSLYSQRYKEYIKNKKTEVFNQLKLISKNVKMSDIKVENLKLQGLITSRTTFITSYLIGTIDGLKEKMLEEKNKMSEEDVNQYGLIVIRERDLVEEFVKKLDLKLIKE